MLIIENFLLALSGLRSNKMRALLTMLGIIIGISSVIAIMSIGNSVSKNMEEEMNSFGMSNLSISLSQRNMEEDNMEMLSPTEDDMLTIDKIDEFQKEMKGEIAAVSMEVSVGSANARLGKKQETANLTGTNSGYQIIKKIKMKKGRYVNSGDVDRAANIVVIPSTLEDKLKIGNDSLVGQEIKFVFDDKILTYTVVGIYDNSEKSGNVFSGYGDSENVYIPVSTANLQTDQMGISFFEAKPSEEYDSQKVADDVTVYFDNLYKNNKNWGVDIYNAQKDADEFVSSINNIKIAISIIAGIALLVGGIGVMNIMLVSVTERTREIGVRKAIGAKRSHIKLQFIIEAIIICGIGGIIGVILGLSISTAVVLYMKNPIVISIPTVIISVLFSMAIGVFFGYYPANKAAKMDPIDALRYE